jgi:L-seryl-tRNA(Ser) seleniumtransferase
MPTKVPQVDKVLRHPLVEAEQSRFRRDLLTVLVRQELDKVRNSPSASNGSEPDIDSIAQRIVERAQALRTPAMRRVINGTGVVLNTNLGRAPLPMPALEAAAQIAAGYCNLEIDLASGKRGKRSARVGELICLLTGAEAAIVVNNNAAAVLLAVNCFAAGKEVIVSRGELIEIGGSFRLPDVIEAGGAVLREVGTTNRTRLSDFSKAINAKTGLLMRCHRSNFEVRGFTEEVALSEMVSLSKEHGIPFLEDLGSGVLFDLAVSESKVGSDEPTVRAVIASGCGVVSFSGDKLLGGPQAGILAGEKQFIEKLAKHPLYRALRPDKITLALLEQIFTAYLHPDAINNIPIWKMISKSVSDIKEQAQNFCRRAQASLKSVSCTAVETVSTTGGGSLPGEAIASYGVAIKGKEKPNKLAERLRACDPPVIAIVQDDQLILDFRTISSAEEELVMQALLYLQKNQ